jgi:hypothetical protein
MLRIGRVLDHRLQQTVPACPDEGSVGRLEDCQLGALDIDLDESNVRLAF